jgi:hypothetical protein
MVKKHEISKKAQNRRKMTKKTGVKTRLKKLNNLVKQLVMEPNEERAEEIKRMIMEEYYGKGTNAKGFNL